jgi:hypothetical protein
MVCPFLSKAPAIGKRCRRWATFGAAWIFIQPTTEDCKNGGWLNFIPSLPFTNQGQCVSYFAQH